MTIYNPKPNSANAAHIKPPAVKSGQFGNIGGSRTAGGVKTIAQPTNPIQAAMLNARRTHGGAGKPFMGK